MDLTPRRDAAAKAEFHITYACDLDCLACTRASFLREPHTASMTLDDAWEFCRQARELDWNPWIIIIGGEPTMHADFEAFVLIATEFNHGRTPQVFSNGYSAKAKRRLAMSPASVCQETLKPGGSVKSAADYPGWTEDMYVSPADLGRPLRPACYQHGSIVCGISVDHDGYSPCTLGGTVDALLHVGGRTKVLADLFDPEKVAAMTAALCAHCGVQGVIQNLFRQDEVDAQPRRFGAPMSPTWVAAFEGRK